MKTRKLFVATLLLSIFLNVFGNKYQETMKRNIQTMDSVMASNNLSGTLSVANSFERIASIEATEWLPVYYAAFCYVIANYMQESKKEKDRLIDKAESFIDKAEGICKTENVEILILKAYIIQARSNVNPPSRARKYAPVVEEKLTKAYNLDPENPRYYFMRAENMFYTPKMFGGGKDKAKPLFEKSLEKYSEFRPLSGIHPNWGKERATMLLSQCQKN